MGRYTPTTEAIHAAAKVFINAALSQNALRMSVTLDGVWCNGASLGDWHLTIRKKPSAAELTDAQAHLLTMSMEERYRYLVGAVQDVFDVSELTDLACIGSMAPAEDALGRLFFAAGLGGESADAVTPGEDRDAPR